MERAISPQTAWNRRNRKAIWAHGQKRQALRRGDLVPLPCGICGAKAEAHHEDYDRPLDVIWLCRYHHRRHHDKQPGDLFAEGW